jgi:hypothetical protein
VNGPSFNSKLDYAKFDYLSAVPGLVAAPRKGRLISGSSKGEDVHIRAAIIAVVGLVTGMGAFAEAPTKLDPGAFEAVQEAFQALVKRGVTSEDSSISVLGPDATYVGDPKASTPFVERVRTQGGLMVRTRLPVTGQPERPQKDVAELTGRIKDACASGGGVLERRDPASEWRSPRTPVVVRGTNVLSREGLIGQLWCRAPSDAALFMVEVRPASEAWSPPLTLGWHWNIGFDLVSPVELEKHKANRLEYEKAVAALRFNLKVGAQVQIRTSDLPDQLTSEWRERHRYSVGNMCGMVTDVKSPIAQVQIRSTQLAVEIQNLFPQGSKKDLSDVFPSNRDQPQTWCAK